MLVLLTPRTKAVKLSAKYQNVISYTCWPTGGEAMDCGNCGNAQPDEARFCGRCGSQLTDAGQDQIASAGRSPPAGLAYAPPTRRRSRDMSAAAVVVVVLAALVVTGWQEHWPSAVFGRARGPASPDAEAPLPADAAGTANQDAGLDDVACPNVQSCVTVGYYFTRDNPGEGFGSTRGLIETLSHGVWTPAAAPADVASSQLTFLQLDGVARPAEGICVAVGAYGDTQNVEGPLVETLSNGTWTAARASLPAGAAVAKQYVFFDSAACPAGVSCMAVGGYKPQNGGSQGLIETAGLAAST